MGSLVFSAFTVEAYLNHLGQKVFKSWRALERLGPKEKLDVIAEKIGLKIEYGKKPWSIMKELFGFRNEIAHGKTIKVDTVETILLEKHDFRLREFARTPWEKFCTMQNAERARQDVQSIVEILHREAGIQDERPFVGGVQSGDSTLAEE